MTRVRRTSLIAGLILSGLACGAAAPKLDDRKIDDRELDLVRGGYLTAAGITFGFGASVTTLVDGALALQSTLTVTDGGAILSQRVGQETVIAPLTPATAAAAGFAGLQGAGVIAKGSSGASAIVQSLNGSQVLNLLLNTANGRTIAQNTAVTLTLPNFPELQRNVAAQQISTNLLSAVSVSAIGAVHH